MPSLLTLFGATPFLSVVLVSNGISLYYNVSRSIAPHVFTFSTVIVAGFPCMKYEVNVNIIIIPAIFVCIKVEGRICSCWYTNGDVCRMCQEETGS